MKDDQGWGIYVVTRWVLDDLELIRLNKTKTKFNLLSKSPTLHLEIKISRI